MKIQFFLKIQYIINILNGNQGIRYGMPERNNDTERCSPKEASCRCPPGSVCSVEAVLSVDERGQMVLPKDVRKKAGIRPGDRLALITWEKDGEVCCLALMKAEGLGDMVKRVLGPLMDEAE